LEDLVAAVSERVVGEPERVVVLLRRHRQERADDPDVPLAELGVLAGATRAWLGAKRHEPSRSRQASPAARPSGVRRKCSSGT
jgi:hypothetical protein